MNKYYLKPLLENAPTSWAIIRACEAEMLADIEFTKPILEVGCGDGILSQILFKNKLVIDEAIDIDHQEIKRSKQTAIYNNLSVMDVHNMAFKNRSFKTVFSNGVLEHIPNLEKALAEINRILMAKGTLIITCPTKYLTSNLFFFNLLAKLGFNRLARYYGLIFNKVFKHINLYNKNEWKKILDKSGFSLKKFKVYNTRKIIWIHELLLPFALFSKLTKKYFNTQVFLKTLRIKIILAPLIYLLLKIKCTCSEEKLNSSALIIAEKK